MYSVVLLVPLALGDSVLVCRMVVLVPLGLVGSLLVLREPLALLDSVHPVFPLVPLALGDSVLVRRMVVRVPLVLGGSLLVHRVVLLALPLLLLDRSDWAPYWAATSVTSLRSPARVSRSC